MLVGQPSLLTVGLQLKDSLSARGVSAQVTDSEDVSRDTLFLGLYGDALKVDQYLQSAGVRIDDMLGVPLASDLRLGGTAVTVLDENHDRHVLLLLADTPETLSGAVSRLISGDFRSDLLSDYIALTGAVGASGPGAPGGRAE